MSGPRPVGVWPEIGLLWTEIVGVWPEMVGVWPETVGAWPETGGLLARDGLVDTRALRVWSTSGGAVL